MPWVHIDDQIALIDFLMQHKEASGPYNACAPEPVRNREFAKRLGRTLHRPAFMPTPALLLKAVLGELSTLLLGSPLVVLTRRLRQAMLEHWPHGPVEIAMRYGEPALPDVLERLATQVP
ncbi:hypothetical protein WR25_09995 [Diploscapter pachys]|uniref:DUF1731 domain-containing protein n=1 Tax=Diploscapter pachys TaxID=2018661 RepID=A0A2A2KD65_9BILA|nr:hypothetical protein WR25_09995 [Diploscapter pachys]